MFRLGLRSCFSGERQLARWFSERKMPLVPFPADFPAKYEPRETERGIYDWWMSQKLFQANRESAKPSFSMILPPPNVTGVLHIGHALTCAIQDSIARWKKMSGYEVAWVPGQDHAGIATQVVVEKMLQKEKGVTRHDLGRENFVKEVYKWKESCGHRIYEQLKRMGVSLDWSRDFFTMDSQRNDAVTEAFVRLFDAQLIYRDTRMVNWCPALKTAISDIEVDVDELAGPTELWIPSSRGKPEKCTFGVIYTIGYVVQGSDEILRVSTTRPETILGDTGLAVHPKDARYKHLIGKFVASPVHDRIIPIVGDALLVDPEFGTGVVKITPAHDPNDFECGKRHGLAQVSVFTDDGLIASGVAAGYDSLTRFDARSKILADLDNHGLFFGKTDNPMRIARCSRTGDIIEPMVKAQWFVKCADIATSASRLVESDAIEIVPREHRDTWFRWMNGIHDWCISRQLWWGHRVPAYKVVFAGDAHTVRVESWIVAKSRDDALAKARLKYGSAQCFDLVQDEDVLDTWFSSAVLPLSAFGWPNMESADLKRFYPLSLMETGSDILFFWVARMVMLCTFLDGRGPFTRVLLHPVVRDSQGRKMSKSLGNVIDPLHVMDGISLPDLTSGLLKSNLDAREVEKATKNLKKEFPEGIEQCGADALRLCLVDYLVQGRQINMDIQRVVSARNFAQKVWQATRFCLPHLTFSACDARADEWLLLSDHLLERWILSRLQSALQACNHALQEGSISDASRNLHEFFVSDFCDVYIEISKTVLYDENVESSRKTHTKMVLYTVLSSCLRAFHPFMPFVTEVLWYHLLKSVDKLDVHKSLMMCTFPSGQEFQAPQLQSDSRQVTILLDVIRSARGLKQLRSPKATECIIACGDSSDRELLSAFSKHICSLARFSTVRFVSDGCSLQGVIRRVVSTGVTVFLPMSAEAVQTDLIRLKKKQADIECQLAMLDRKTKNPAYGSRVPQAVQETDAARIEQLQAELSAVEKDRSEIQQ
ncbi:mitochondrial valyl-tRNA synthetase (ValRS) [Andalucia godoyi]|uniref:valine--tRNA ligase n=1 Tax=Andalucia godoyi TaxID=505711 RepID=A0A8K0F345_ANDGO|nr:mitochondrial valyl-tRNA synthetase (ValRS) [Andalucia godoyi]|eukprot:ANDGO_02372.mRNA.1 mitochondrial valyl-tRNA synthetase (ValRS)